MIQDKAKILYGYMRFNWAKWQWEFVPGLLRDSLPVVEAGQELG